MWTALSHALSISLALTRLLLSLQEHRVDPEALRSALLPDFELIDFAAFD